MFAQTPCSSTVVGTLHVEQLQSALYGEQRTVRIWLPPDYETPGNSQRRYPVLYFFDGQTLFDRCTAFAGEGELQLDETLIRLIDAKTVAPMIVVGMDSSGRRSYEYSIYPDPISNPGAPEPIGRQLPKFVVDEVMPYVAQHYRTMSDPAATGIGGTSLGAMAAFRDTEFLGRGPDRVYIGVGTAELNGPPADKFAVNLRMSIADANAGFARMAQILADHLKNANLNRPDVTLVVEPDGHRDQSRLLSLAFLHTSFFTRGCISLGDSSTTDNDDDRRST